MPAVIRVKRRIDEEPLSAFVLNCKRRKLEENSSINLLASQDETTTILKFAGTLETQDEDQIATKISKLTKDQAKELINKIRKPNIVCRKRSEMKQNCQNARFKVVNCYRTLTPDDLEPSTDALVMGAKKCTIVDIEKQTTNFSNDAENQKPTTANDTPTTSQHTDSSNYVYDIYFPETDDLSAVNELPYDNFNEDLFSVRPFNDLRNDVECTGSDSDDENVDEDSNDENNWRNDYPDEDDDCNDDLEDRAIRKAVEKFDFEDSLSSDEDENHNGFAYSVDSDAIGFEDDIDYCEINRYGEDYACFKPRSSLIFNRRKINSDDEDDENDVDESDEINYNSD